MIKDGYFLFLDNFLKGHLAHQSPLVLIYQLPSTSGHSLHNTKYPTWPLSTPYSHPLFIYHGAWDLKSFTPFPSSCVLGCIWEPITQLKTSVLLTIKLQRRWAKSPLINQSHKHCFGGGGVWAWAPRGVIDGTEGLILISLIHGHHHASIDTICRQKNEILFFF